MISFTKLEKTIEEEGSVIFFTGHLYITDLQVSSKSIEYLCVEVENKNSKNIILNLVYCTPNGEHKELENYTLKTLSLSKREIAKKYKIMDMLSPLYNFGRRFQH